VPTHITNEGDIKRAALLFQTINEVNQNGSKNVSLSLNKPYPYENKEQNDKSIKTHLQLWTMWSRYYRQ
jgi:hypothetical protein